MATKRALVVDDSKSARVILSRMLENYGIQVDMAESAEQALEYLKTNRPDAIFMDHLMPGMDGLQAVQAIKGNPQTAMIPIMMYTSQEGELYVGQARALGAMGVLPKQVRPVDVSKVLYELRMLPDRRDAEAPVLMPVQFEDGTPIDFTPPPKPDTSRSIDWGKRVETTVKDQAVDIRRFMVASLDSFAARIVSDLRDGVSHATPLAEPAALHAPRIEKSPLPWIAAVIATGLVALAFAVSWMSTRGELEEARAQIAGLSSSNAELQRMRLDLAANVKDLTAAVAAREGGTTLSTGPAGGVLSMHTETVPYGEIPFDRGRLDALREMLNKLEATGFHGVVRVVNYLGQYCLSGSSADGYTLAPSTTLLGKCDVIGNPFEDSLPPQQRQSLAFANLVAGVKQRTAGTITVSIEAAGTGRAALPYPTRSEAMSAGEWNRAAAANNRVEFSAESASN
jgi:CheY-like chemotaxis protein